MFPEIQKVVTEKTDTVSRAAGSKEKRWSSYSCRGAWSGMCNFWLLWLSRRGLFACII